VCRDNEIDETQRLNYPAIVNYLHSTGYKVLLLGTFRKEDKIASLKQQGDAQICDVG